MWLIIVRIEIPVDEKDTIIGVMTLYIFWLLHKIMIIKFINICTQLIKYVEDHS
jgi:hypothetical protein